ncbi:MAG: PhoPQ-activated pathogenicity-related family protein [Phycisphaerae bacterium]|nr:PhoPQ-activated pathogenicity-related family protein [Phycisphaerae bacterium]
MALVICGFRLPSAFGTALDDYVHRPDAAFKYEVVRTMESPEGTGYILDMVSQSWRSADEVNRTEWRHWVHVAVPKALRHKTAMMIVDGGRVGEPMPERVDGAVASIAVRTQSVVARVRMVPNQPLRFAGEDSERWEDAIIAYSWDRFIETGDSDWPVQLPMVKSVVRAMDAVQELVSQRHQAAVKAFVVTGASKRGWTTWLTAAVDARVAAIAPIVIDMLNARESFDHHRAVYGFYAPAVRDYEQMDVFARIGSPEAEKLLAIVDPYAYRDRLTMPKFILNSAQDQFFLPDSWQFYYDGLKGDKYLRYVPNTGHGLEDSDAMETVVMFYQGVLEGWKLPRFKVSYPNEGMISVRPVDAPAAVRLWQATNPNARDFRIDVLGRLWSSVVLQPDGEGRYVAQVEKPAQGFTAFFMELMFDNPRGHPLKFTTGTRVIPDVKPFAEKPAAAVKKKPD